MTPDLVPIRRALVSVSDKEGLTDLARCLASFSCEIISSGGTRRYLEANGIPSQDVAAFTGTPPAFQGRMKTLSFPLASALLFDRERHAEEAERLGIRPIDMVVCTFYPFEQAPEGASLDDLVELIDVGGPTMVRAAAKNARFVAVVVDPGDYGRIISELERTGGALGLATRLDLMRKAFARTADYDASISVALDRLAGVRTLRPVFEQGRIPRYGENPHQGATVYRVRGALRSLLDCVVLHGKELSYNNFVDIQHALASVRDLPDCAVAVVKHTNPCGLAVADTPLRALELAWESDPVSAFGSVIAFTTPVDGATAAFLALDHPDKSRRKFVEVIAAPSFSEEALASLTHHKTLRLVVADPRALDQGLQVRASMGVALVQEDDRVLHQGLTLAGAVKVTLDRELIEFGLVAVRQLSSNAIAIVRRLPCGAMQLLGIGCGQPNRVGAIELALQHSLRSLRREAQATGSAPGDLRDAVLVSDGFLPFADNVEACARHGIRIIVQPGGSIRDASIIARADECGIAMVLTGIRHFRH